MTDPIAEFIVRFKNAAGRRKESVTFPYSKMIASLLEAMRRERYVESFAKKGKKAGRLVEAKFPLGEGARQVSGARRISKPSRRMYRKAAELRPVRNGYGVLFISTPKGILSDREARREKVGGEPLFEIW